MQLYPSIWLTYNNKRQLLAIIFLLICTTAEMIVQILVILYSQHFFNRLSELTDLA